MAISEIILGLPTATLTVLSGLTVEYLDLSEQC